MSLTERDIIVIGKLLSFNWTGFTNDGEGVCDPKTPTTGGRKTVDAMKEVISLIRTMMEHPCDDWRCNLYELVLCFEEVKNKALVDHEGFNIWVNATGPIVYAIVECDGENAQDAVNEIYYGHWLTVQKKLQLHEGVFRASSRNVPYDAPRV